jgi:hypothetical protein
MPESERYSFFVEPPTLLLAPAAVTSAAYPREVT